MIASIPARGGSKGVPKKNIRELSGKPLIFYTINAAQKSRYISRIIISTDSFEIAEVAKSFGCEIPFMRPPELATDTSKALDAYLYTVEKLNTEFNEQIRDFSVLLPTSPLRNAEDIDKAIEIFYSKRAKTVISVVEAEHPPTWYKKINDKGILEDYFRGEDNSLNRQEAEKTYLPNGAIYIFNYNSLKLNCNYYNDETYPYIMSRKSSVDIDTEVDFKLAELIIRSSQLNYTHGDYNGWEFWKINVWNGR